MVSESDFLGLDSPLSSCPPHPTCILFLLGSLSHYFAIDWFQWTVPFLLPFLQLSLSSHFFFARIQERCEFGPKYVFPLQIFMSQSCLCREASGQLGISLKGIAFKQRWIVPSSAAHCKLDYFLHLSLLAEHLFPSESENYFLHVYAKLRAQGFPIAFKTLSNGLQSIFG